MAVSALDIAPNTAVRLRSRLYAVPRAPWLKVLGPAFAVSIGYIDPGNWATDLAAGAYGYRLLWVVLLANVIALVLQIAVAELTTATGCDLATHVVRRWPRAKGTLWFVFQGAAVATDVSEFAGIVLGLELLLRLSPAFAIAAGLFIVFAVLRASDAASKGLELGAIAALVAVAAACIAQVPALHPVWGAMLSGAFVPSVPSGSLVVLVGIVGATVMPHNLFLHSALVRRAAEERPTLERRWLARIFTRETLVALNVAAVINIALVAIGVAVGGAGASLQQAFGALVRDGGIGALLFGGGLLLSGIAASTTATAAGDHIFAVFSTRTFSRTARRAFTLLPAAALLFFGCDIGTLLVWSQVALALVLPIALVPLIALLVSHRASIPHGRTVAAATAAMSAVCVAFDGVMLVQMVHA